MTPRHEIPTPGAALAQAEALRAQIPELRTARLRLRAPQLSDFDTYAEIVCGPRGAYVGGPMAREDGAWFDFIQLSSLWLLQGHGGWTVEDRSGAVLGFVILGLEPGDQEVELGFLFTEAAEGQGYAHEAATRARDYAQAELGISPLVSYVTRGNRRSVRLAERLGAVARAPEGWPHPDILVYRHPETAHE